MLLKPPTETTVSARNLSQSLMQAGKSSITHKGPTKSMSSTPDLITPRHQKDLPVFFRDLSKSSMSPFLGSNKSESRLLAAHKPPSVPLLNSSPVATHTKHAKFVESQTPVFSSAEIEKIFGYSKTPSNRLNFSLSPRPLAYKEDPKKSPFTYNKKTVVLDLDETLIHASHLIIDPDHVITKTMPDGATMRIRVKIRPYAKEFITMLSKLADIIIFTAGVQAYADPIIDLLDPQHTLIVARYYRESCQQTSSGFLKDLKILNIPLKDVLIIDNLASSFTKQKENGILISSYFGDHSDAELLKLSRHIRRILSYDDLRQSDKNFQRIL